MKYKVALLLNKTMANSIFDEETLKFFSEFAEYDPICTLPEIMTEEYMLKHIADADAAITCWGTPRFTPEMFAAAPNLRLIAHAAGSIKKLVPPEFWKTGCRLTSDAPIIAQGVAQTVLALTLTSLLQLWSNAAETRRGNWQGGETTAKYQTKQLYGLKIGPVGFSSVCREVIKLFKNFDCDIYVADPYTSDLEIRRFGVNPIGLDELMATCDVVSLHAPANEDCRNMINAKNIPLLKDGAIFINTARGMLVDEEALIKELKTGRIFACIDVTATEPLAKDHPFRKLDNVVLTSHVAGGHTINGRHRLGENAVIQTYNCLTKGLLSYDIHEDMIARMA